MKSLIHRKLRENAAARECLKRLERWVTCPGTASCDCAARLENAAEKWVKIKQENRS
jgi:hypothetical protein